MQANTCAALPPHSAERLRLSVNSTSKFRERLRLDQFVRRSLTTKVWRWRKDGAFPSGRRQSRKRKKLLPGLVPTSGAYFFSFCVAQRCAVAYQKNQTLRANGSADILRKRNANRAGHQR